MADLWTPPGQPLWTADGYINGFIKQPGAHALYRAGRIVFAGVTIHYTVGRDSTAIMLRGIFPILLPKFGPGKMACPWDAVNYHACEWNRRMVGVETEKMGDWEPTTPDQIKSLATIAAAFVQLGVRFGYDGSTNRVPVGAALRQPYTAHRTLQHVACDQHVDYLPDADMAAAFAQAGGGGAVTPEDNDRKEFFLMDTYPTAVLADGSVLTVGHGVGGNNSEVFAHLARPDGTTIAGWHPIGGRIYDSPQLTVTPDGTRVHITGSGDEGSPDLAGSFNVPFRNVYVHDTAKTFGARFLGWRMMGDPKARIRPAIAPGV